MPLLWLVHQQHCAKVTKKQIHEKRSTNLYFGQFELEEVRAAGSHKHCGEQLGVWFHLYNDVQLQYRRNRVIKSNKGA